VDGLHAATAAAGVAAFPAPAASSAARYLRSVPSCVGGRALGGPAGAPKHRPSPTSASVADLAFTDPILGNGGLCSRSGLHHGNLTSDDRTVQRARGWGHGPAP